MVFELSLLMIKEKYFATGFMTDALVILHFRLSFYLPMEAEVSRDGVTNSRNHHVWTNEIRHAILHSRHQQAFSQNE
jgi:hypothetical protein